MRIAILNADYPKFLAELYLSNPGLSGASYDEQMGVRNATLFGVVDFYSRNFQMHGHNAFELHLNNPWLQYAWACEHGLRVDEPISPERFAHDHGVVGKSGGVKTYLPATSAPAWPLQPSRASLKKRLREGLRPVARPLLRPFNSWLHRLYVRRQGAWRAEILRAQIKILNPDFLLNQEMSYLSGPELGELKSSRLLIGQIASSLPRDESFESYDMVISSLPNQVAWFRARDVRAELNRLAFDASVLDQLGPPPPRDIPVSFVGSLSPDHASRINFLEYLARHVPLKVWGNGIERLPQSSPLHACYQGEAWGRDMYEILRRSRITLNFHIDLSEGWANNLRLYEATGVGTLLLTDMKRNLAELFVPGEHVVTYESGQDCVTQIGKLLGDDALREKIAAAGQRHTLEVHSFFLRTAEIAALAESLRGRSGV